MLARLFGNMGLKNKIAICSIGLVVLSTLLMAVFFFRYVSSQIKETAYVNSTDMSVQIGNYFDEKLKSLFQRVYALRSNDMFSTASYLGKFLLNDEPYYHALALSQLSGVLSEIRMSDPFINSVYIYTPKGDFYDLARLKKPGFDFDKTVLHRKIQSASNFTVLWGERVKDEIYADGKEIIPVVIPFTVEGYSQSCYIVISLDVDAIQSYLKNIYSDGGSSIVILDDKSNQILSNWEHMSPVLLTEGDFMEKLLTNEKDVDVISHANDRYIVAYNTATVAPWKIVILRSEKFLTRSLSKASFYVVVITCANILLCLLIALLLSNSITKPLRLLEKTIKKVTNRDFDAKFNYEYENEVGQLGKSFNFMLNEISDLIGRLNASIQELQLEKERVRDEQQLKRMAELKALQSQINPHFLYNTLNSIIWMADRVNATDISMITARLGTLFKISLSKGQELIPLRDEIEHVSSYLSIQKIRYGKKLNYSIDMDEDIMELITVKLILQPFVENSIYHGIKEKDGPGNIKIRGHLDESGEAVELTVTDDGLGIPPQLLELINRRLKAGYSGDQEGYGIYNVNERIRLNFGEDYGVLFFTSSDQTTEVRIRIPALKKEEMERYVQTDYSGG